MPDIFGNPTEAELRMYGYAPPQQVAPAYAPPGTFNSTGTGYSDATRAAVNARNTSGMSTYDEYLGDQLVKHEERATPQRDNSPDALAYQPAFPEYAPGNTGGATNRDTLGNGAFGARAWMRDHPVGMIAAMTALAAGGAAAMPGAMGGAAAGGGAAGAGAAGTAGAGTAAGTGLGTGAAGGLQASSGLGVFANGGTAGLAGVGGGNAGALAASGAITGGAGTAGAGSGLLGRIAGNAGTLGRNTGLTGQAQGAVLGQPEQGGGVMVPSMQPTNSAGMPVNQFMLMQMQRNKRAQELRQKRNRTPEEDDELEELTKPVGLLG